MRIFSNLQAKGSLTVDGVVAFNSTATGQTPTLSDSSTKLATTAFIKNQSYLSSLPIATASVLGGIIVGTGLAVDASGVLSVPGAASGTLRAKQTFTATTAQTTFTILGGYTVGLLDVFVNGVLLTGTSVTASDGSTVVLTDAAETGDIVDVIVYSVLNSGFISGTTDSLLEGTTNLYFTTARARAAVSATAPIVYSAGVFSIPAATGSVNGYLTSTDWTTFNNKQNALTNPVTGTGTTNYLVKSTGSTTIGASSVFDNGTIVAIGTTTSSYKFTIESSANDVTSSSVYLNNTNAGTAAASYLQMGASGAGAWIGLYSSVHTNTAWAGRLVFGLASQGNGISLNASGTASQDIRFAVQAGEVARMTANRNFLLGTVTDAGFRQDIWGTTRVVGPSAQDSAAQGGEILTSTGWTSTGWTGDFTTGFTHTTGNTTALTNTYSIGASTWVVLALTITGRTAGSVTVTLGGGSVGPYTATTTVGIRGFSTGALSIAPTTDFNGTLLVSIKSPSLINPTSSWTGSDGTARIEIRTINSTGNMLFGTGAGGRMVASAATNNTVFGAQAGNYQVTGSNNTYFGNQSGQYVTNGINNTFIGSLTGVNNYNTANSVYMGVNAGYNASSGNHNIYIGVSTGYNNTSGAFNAAIGGIALNAATSGSNNSVLGYGALGVATTVSNTVAFGYQAAYYIADLATSALTVTNSIFLGYRARPNADSETNQIAIGYNVAGLGSNTTVIGNSSTTLTALYGSTIINATTIQTSAVLQADSTTKGFLPPRMTSAQRTAISSPATGLVVYQTDGTEGLYIKTASAWRALAMV